MDEGERKPVAPNDRRPARLEVLDGGFEVVYGQRDAMDALSAAGESAADRRFGGQRRDKLEEEAVREAKDGDLADGRVLGRAGQLQAEGTIAFDRLLTVLDADDHVIDTDDCAR